MTSNIGSHIIQQEFEKLNEENEDEIIDTTTKLVFEELRHHVRPEFLNRVDDVVMFSPLSKKDIAQIVELNLEDVKKRLLKSDINFTWTESAVNHISEIGYDPQFGARPVKRVIQNEVLNELSKDILSNKITKDFTINLDYVDDRIVFENIVPEEIEIEE